MTDPQWLTVCLWMIVVLVFWCAALAVNIRALRHQIDGDEKTIKSHQKILDGIQNVFRR